MNAGVLAMPWAAHSLVQSTLKHGDTFPRYAVVFVRQLTIASRPPLQSSSSNWVGSWQDSVPTGAIISGACPLRRTLEGGGVTAARRVANTITSTKLFLRLSNKHKKKSPPLHYNSPPPPLSFKLGRVSNVWYKRLWENSFMWPGMVKQ